MHTRHLRQGAATVREMCRNITPLRGLEPVVTSTEIEAAALQFVRKVGGIATVTSTTRAATDRAVAAIAEITAQLLAELPPRRVPPSSLPPLRRQAAAAG